jgi:hypothetical protein
MALILDKTYTGITSTVIVSGFTSGTTGITYNESGWTETIYVEADEILHIPSGYTQITYTTGLTMLSYTTASGIVLDNPYLVIDSILLNKFSENFIHKFPITISVYIYRDQNARKTEMRNYNDEFKYYVETNSEIYNKYFSTSCLLNTCVYKKAYEYINTLYPGWKSDEV